MFKVGQRVICVDDTLLPHSDPILIYPKKGQIYTVRALLVAVSKYGVYLEEIVNGNVLFDIEPAFHSIRFRALDFAENICEEIEQEQEELVEAFYGEGYISTTT